MCGLAGLLSFENKKVNESDAWRMIKVLNHRGPDHQQIWAENNISLCHARLSILDLTIAGNQPMTSDDERLVIVYNGEVYNFLELRKELIISGYHFHTGTDTEVIIKGFSFWGIDLFKKLNGIFAIAVWDRIDKKLYLVRDRFGVKPLYYFTDKNYFIFGSEIKAILESGKVSKRLSKAALHEFIYYGSTIDNKTLFQDIQKLKPGSYLTISTSHIEETEFWSINNIDLQNNIKYEDAVNETRHRIENAIQRQLVSDVPVGIFLSGGIDSSCITAYASKYYNKKIDTFSCAFDFDMGINELEKARMVANHFDTSHHEMFIKGENISDIILTLITHHDEPFSDAANIPLYLLCRELNGSHKVILQGDGGDEIFAGYRRYNILDNISVWAALAPILIGACKLLGFKSAIQFRRLLEAINQPTDAMRMAMLLTTETLYDSPTCVFSKDLQYEISTIDPFSYYKSLDSLFATVDPVQKMLWVDSQIILPSIFLEKVDKSTMASGVEVRVPLLDYEITDYVMGLPSSFKVQRGNKKRILKEALRGVVPDSVLDGPKTGFGVPYGNWLKKPLYNFMISIFEDNEIKAFNIFDNEVLSTKINEHINGKKDNGFLLWKSLNLALWLKEYKVEI